MLKAKSLYLLLMLFLLQKCICAYHSCEKKGALKGNWMLRSLRTCVLFIQPHCTRTSWEEAKRLISSCPLSHRLSSVTTKSVPQWTCPSCALGTDFGLPLRVFLGTGEDAYRTWESLALGAVPVVANSTLWPLFAGSPICVLKNWNSSTGIEQFRPRVTSRRMVLAQYWFDLINSYREQP